MSRSLAEGIPLVDREQLLSRLVGGTDLRNVPLHRWFSYKEAFSPRLPGTVLDLLGVHGDLAVVDPFGGVATTALALRDDPRVSDVRSVEYSPLAHAIGAAKLSWPALDPSRLRHLVNTVLDYGSSRNAAIPSLSAFTDRRIFDETVVRSLVSARNAILRAPGASDLDREFLLVGLAGVVEDSSKAMKDGRALRILGERKRHRTSLVPRQALQSARRDPVKQLLASQWAAMIEDLEELSDKRHQTLKTPAVHLRGDARRLAACRLPDSNDPAFPSDSINISIFSPPYLNFIDYTEVYKLELWLLGHVRDQATFRRLRLGTLRSHPSVRFGEKPGPSPRDHAVIDVVHRLSGWVAEHGLRPEVGPIIRHYFEDMYAVFAEQLRVLAHGGTAVCVVANSTLSRREKRGDDREEIWRIPVLTDVLLAHIARLVGFSHVELWRARDLRARNVRGGAARESLVIARR